MANEEEASSKLNHLRFEFLSLNHFYYQDVVTVRNKGQVPLTLGNLKQLESLDLSLNKLIGEIPPQLASLTFLSVLNLSFNQLEGMILRGNQIQTFTEASFQGNKGLCRPPLNANCIVEGLSLPTFEINKHLNYGFEIDWDIISTEIGFVVGLGIIICWKGVTCDKAGHLTGLDLNRKSISGGINHSSILFSLQFLQNLNWAHNNFTFTQIPPGFSKLTRLTYLNLSNANVAGQIPIELLYMTNLVTLDSSTHYFSRVPSLKLENPNLLTLVQNLTGLKQLILAGNNLSALVLEIFADLPNLRSLHLYFSSLYGKVLEKIFQVSTLEALDLSENSYLLGLLPQFPSNGSLHTLVLSNTNFSGTLPDSVGNLRVLSRIELSRCNFSGLIPNSIANLTQLLYLDLSYNNFTAIEFSKESLPSLDTLDLSRSKLQGSIHSSFFELRSLNVLMLSFNNFSGTMQLEMIQRLQNLTELELSYNSLLIDASDSKASLSSFPQLDKLKMASCKLQRIPEPRNQSRMIILELSANQILGRITNWICKIGSLMQLNVSHNLIVDMEKPYKFPSLFVLDVHSNQLHGEIPIPPEFVTYVDYSSNHFNSSILAKTGTSLPLLISSLFK
ncbi:receptor-like protein 7 [Camellia sinensis]|uniref:receptor-like protein 7 n=1 Tax=Camellia sinensis TaxID=4442 RepID=UPI0010361A49|nr:receptor-like protein 7 [Camellia sinensis]